MIVSYLVCLFLLIQSDNKEQEPTIDLSVGCKECHFSGAIDCKNHGALFEHEIHVDFCSFAAQCKDCSGSMLKDCKHCESGPKRQERLRRIGKIERFMNEKTDAGELLEQSLPRLITPHFDICITAKKMKNGSKNVNTHELMHLMAQECEKAAEIFNSHFEAKSYHYSGRSRLWYWNSEETHKEICINILGSNGGADLKLYGANPALSSFSNGRGLENKALNVVRNSVHVAAHLMLSSVHGPQWIGNKKAGWFDVGAAHWYELKLFSRTATYCIEEGNSGVDYEGGMWHTAVKKYLKKNKSSILPKLTQLTSGVLEKEQHALSWSLYDYMVSNHTSKLKKILLGFKAGETTRDLFKKHLNMSVIQVEEAWRQWVAETYPIKNPKPRKKV